jgi:hypothetical protein
MDITIEYNGTLAKICRDVNLTPAELVESFIVTQFV